MHTNQNTTMTTTDVHRSTISPPALPTVRLGQALFHAVTERQAIAHVMDELAAGRGGWVVPMNLDVLRRYERDASFAELVAPASLFVADGMPLIWASRLQGTPLPERVAGSSMILTVSAEAAARGRSIFMLGGDEGVADAAAAVLRGKHPGINIVGTFCPPFGFENDAAMMQRIKDMLTDAKPDICYVALGCPKQERLIVELRPLVPTTWWFCVGISFSFVCGQVKRAPRWMQKLGLEWVHRLCQEPRRLFKRYLLVGVPYAIRLLAGACRRRLASRSH